MATYRGTSGNDGPDTSDWDGDDAPLTGGGGDDWLRGNGGNDILYDGAGNDTFQRVYPRGCGGSQRGMHSRSAWEPNEEPALLLLATLAASIRSGSRPRPPAPRPADNDLGGGVRSVEERPRIECTELGLADTRTRRGGDGRGPSTRLAPSVARVMEKQATAPDTPDVEPRSARGTSN